MGLNRAKVLETADKLVRQGKLEEAIRHYAALSDDNPRDVNTINRIGDLYVRLRKSKEAIRQFMRIADFYAGDGFHLKAIAMYKKITKLDPSNADANERVADLYAKQGLATEARTQYLSLAEQRLKSGHPKKAMEIYQRVLALEPGNLKVRLILADLQGREGMPAEAVQGLLAVARELRARGLNDEALKVLQKASRLQPQHPELLGQTAEMMQAGGKSPEEVVGTLESLLEAEPGNVKSLQSLAETYLNLGRRADYDRLVASAKDPGSQAVLAQTASQFHLARGDKQAALETLERAAESALRSSDPTGAVAHLEKSAEIDPTRIEVLEKIVEVWTQASDRSGIVSASERLASTLAKRQEWERAAGVLERLQNLDPSNQVAAQLRPLLDEKRGRAPSAGESPGEAEVPSLEDLEKVVELEPEIEDDDSFELGPGTQAGGPLFEDSSEEEEEEVTEGAEAQDAAYSGKSVIQEMRGEPAGQPVDEDFLSEHFTEAEVFLKYGLVEKAKEQLQTIIARYPDHVPSWEKMKEIHSEEGRKPEAAAVALKLAAICRQKAEDDKAREYEEEARGLDPGARVAAGEAPEGRGPTVKAAAPRETPAETPLTELDLEPASEPEPPLPLPAGGEDELSIEIVEEDSGEAPGAAELDAERISEFDFFVQQGLTEEAEEILDSLERASPGHPEILRRRQRLGASSRPAAQELSPASSSAGGLDLDVERAFGRGSGPEASSPAPPEGDAGFFDLAAELRAHVIDSAPDAGSDEPDSTAGPGEEASLDEIFKAFRQKVDQQIEEGDYETRYNLGIAYKEMGLLDEAIGEFQYASREPKLFLECCSILGMCFKEKGMTDLAVKWYRKALESSGHPEEKYQGLRYDLGDLHLERGEFPQALALFSEVYGINSNYRDVASKIRELRKRVG